MIGAGLALVVSGGEEDEFLPTANLAALGALPIASDTLVPHSFPPSPVPDVPEPTSTPVPKPKPQTPLEEIVCAYDWNCDHAFYVLRCETTGFNSMAVGRHGERGIWQIHPIHAGKFTARGWDFYTDAHNNVRATAIAYQIWSGRGWNAWSCW